MTEKQWLAAKNLKQPLKLIGKQSERKRRLFAVACCKRVLHLIQDKRATQALSCIEQYADGLAKPREFDKARESAFTVFDEARGTDEESETLTAEALVADAIWGAATGGLVSGDVAEYASRQAAEAAGASAARGKQGAARASETTAQLHLLHDILGNPFRTVAFDSGWRTSTVAILVQGIYEERTFDQLPILADALQDAGCDNDDILNHFRDPNATHVRGCWALDLVLGKE